MFSFSFPSVFGHVLTFLFVLPVWHWFLHHTPGCFPRQIDQQPDAPVVSVPACAVAKLQQSLS